MHPTSRQAPVRLQPVPTENLIDPEGVAAVLPGAPEKSQ
jgi:hypothetical protein